MSNKFLFFLLMPFLLSVVGCDRVPDDSQGDEMARFNAWIEVNNLSSYKMPSGLYYINEREGTGYSPEDSDIVVYSFVIRNLDDYIYKTTYKDIAKLYGIYGLYNTTHYAPEVSMYFSKNAIPQGFFEGIGIMKEGGKARLIMPSSLAYGGNGLKPISPYTSLIYDVELVRVFKGDLVEYEKTIIDEYKTQYPTFISINDSIYYKHISGVPTSGKPVKGDSVYVNFTGRFIDEEGLLAENGEERLFAENGFIFDTNIKSIAIDSSIYNSKKVYKPLGFVIGDKKVKSGFDLAIRQMEVGNIATFIIPSAFAYGSDGNSDGATVILPYTPLVFNMELVKLKKKTK